MHTCCCSVCCRFPRCCAATECRPLQRACKDVSRASDDALASWLCLRCAWLLLRCISRGVVCSGGAARCLLKSLMPSPRHPLSSCSGRHWQPAVRLHPGRLRRPHGALNGGAERAPGGARQHQQLLPQQAGRRRSCRRPLPALPSGRKGRRESGTHLLAPSLQLHHASASRARKNVLMHPSV